MKTVLIKQIVPDVYSAGIASNNLYILGGFFSLVDQYTIQEFKELLLDNSNEDFSGNYFFLDKDGENVLISHRFAQTLPDLVIATTHLIELIDQWLEVIKENTHDIMLIEENGKYSFKQEISECTKFEKIEDLKKISENLNPKDWPEEEYFERLGTAFKNPTDKCIELPPYGSEMFKSYGRDNYGVLWEIIVERKNGENWFKFACPLGFDKFPDYKKPEYTQEPHS